MKKLNLLLLTGVVLSVISSCNMIDELTNKDIDPDETVAKEGNTWSGSATGFPESTITVSQNDKGIATFTVNYNGQDYAIKGKVSKTKIEDFVYSNGDESKPFTLVDFDAAVGTKWEYKVGTQTVVREVVYKSTDDDYFVPALWLNIKVSQVEETIPEGLVIANYPAQAKKIVWTFNHKFGWIASEVTKTDNTVVNFGLTSTNAGTGSR
jgi:hypothetical protein